MTQVQEERKEVLVKEKDNETKQRVSSLFWMTNQLFSYSYHEVYLLANAW